MVATGVEKGKKDPGILERTMRRWLCAQMREGQPTVCQVPPAHDLHTEAISLCAVAMVLNNWESNFIRFNYLFLCPCTSKTYLQVCNRRRSNEIIHGEILNILKLWTSYICTFFFHIRGRKNNKPENLKWKITRNESKVCASCWWDNNFLGYLCGFLPFSSLFLSACHESRRIQERLWEGRKDGRNM